MSNDAHAKVHRHIKEIMPRIERPASGFLPQPFLAVGYGENYADTIFCWDNQHMNMRFAYAGKPDYFRHTLENLLHHQAADGFTPNIVNAGRGPGHCRPPFHAQPFLMQAALMYLDRTGDRNFVQAVWPKLRKYVAYYEDNWRAPHGLFRWPLAFMSGFDNDVVTTFFQPDTILPCDVNSWICLEYRAASVLARRLGIGDEAIAFRAQAEGLAEAINNVLWSEAVGSYAAFNLCTARSQFALGDKFVMGRAKPAT